MTIIQFNSYLVVYYIHKIPIDKILPSHNIEKLNDRNYRDWAMIMRIILDEEDVLGVMTGTAADELEKTMLALKEEPAPEGTKPITANNRQKIKNALEIIVTAIDFSQLEYIKKEDTAYQV